MADSSKSDSRRGQAGRQDGHRDYVETRKAKRALERMKLQESGGGDDLDDDPSDTQEGTRTMPPPPPPARRGSKSARSRKASDADASSTLTAEKSPVFKNLPPGVTSEMVNKNLDKIDRLRQPLPQSSAPRAQLVEQVEIDSDTLPVGLSVFCNRRLFTRELVFNLKRLNSLETIKTLVKTYFAYEAKRIGLPSEVYFAGIHCVYHRSANEGDVVTYGAFMTDYEYQLAHAEIADGKTTTGQILRLQVALYTDAQLAEDQDKLKHWFADGEYDAMQDINGLKWILDFPDTEKPYTDTRIFEVDRDNTQVITIPAHRYRENVEKARLGDVYKENFINVVAAKAKIRNKEFDLRKDMIEEIRGLRRMLREAGETDIDMAEVKIKAREAEDTERGGKVQFDGETQDFKHMKELRKEVESQSDRINSGEAAAFDRSFLNI